MKSKFFLLGLILLCFSSCEEKDTDYSMNVVNQSSTEITVSVVVDGVLSESTIPAGEERVVFAESCGTCLESSFTCLSNIDTVYLAAADDRIAVYNLNNPGFWNYSFSENSTGFQHKCLLELKDSHLY